MRKIAGKKSINKLCAKETISVRDKEKITEIKVVDLPILRNPGGKNIPISGTGLVIRDSGKKVCQRSITDFPFYVYHDLLIKDQH